MSKRKIRRISLAEVVSINNTKAAKRLVVQYGYEPARSMNDLIDKISFIIREHEQEGLNDIARIHPHYGLIEQVVIGDFYSNASGFAPRREAISSACGCGGHSNMGGKIASQPSPIVYSGELSDEYIDANGNSKLSAVSPEAKSAVPVTTKTEVVKVVETKPQVLPPAKKSESLQVFGAIALVAIGIVAISRMPK